MNNKQEGIEEGSICNRDNCTGVMKYKPDGDCYCHSNPPCEACVNSILACSNCSFEIENHE